MQIYYIYGGEEGGGVGRGDGPSVCLSWFCVRKYGCTGVVTRQTRGRGEGGEVLSVGWWDGSYIPKHIYKARYGLYFTHILYLGHLWIP